MAELYRKSLLDKISSPEQLDKAVTIISPSFWIAAAGGGLIIIAVLVWALYAKLPVTLEAEGVYINRGGIHSIYAGAAGTVESVSAVKGEYVNKGDVIVHIDSGREEIRAPFSGTLMSVNVSEGSAVSEDSIVCRIAQGDPEDMIVICYVPVREEQNIREGMRVMIYPSGAGKQEYGHMEATVASVDSFVTSAQDMQAQLGTEALAHEFCGDGAVASVICEIENGQGLNEKLSEPYTAAIISAEIIIEEKTPFSILFSDVS